MISDNMIDVEEDESKQQDTCRGCHEQAAINALTLVWTLDLWCRRQQPLMEGRLPYNMYVLGMK